MDLDWTQQSAAGVSLVTARLRNERATDRQVRLENCLDGPILPPRRNEVPEAGWDRDGVTTVVPAGNSVALGYACPAPESTPPVAIDSVGPAGDDEETDAVAAVRELGDHRPPREVLAASDESGELDGPTGTEMKTTASETDHAPDIDDPLAEFRTRVETVEALRAAGVQEATDLLAANGGIAGVEALASSLDADAAQLRTLAAAAETLADRAEAATPPTESLRRLS
jgi:hypothetical protein